MNQESFAKYAYFTTIEGHIVFANNDQIRGPVHSTDQIKIASSGATFFDQVSTAARSIRGQSYGNFVNYPPKLSVTPIPLPSTQAFTALQTQATNGGVAFTGNTNGASSGEASIRIEFVAIDLNTDGDSTDANEGSVRIYQDNARPWYVTGHLSGAPDADIRRTPNCGAQSGVPLKFVTDSQVNWGGGTPAAATTLMQSATARCYLGGDPRLFQAKRPSATLDTAAWLKVRGAWTATIPGWRPRPNTMTAPAVAAFTNRPDKD